MHAGALRSCSPAQGAGNMFYRRRGQGPVLILLHGFASSSLFWADLMDRLGTRFDVIAPDWPGFGATPDAVPYASLAEFTTGLIGLADELGLERFHVLGHSMSGFVVQALLCDHAVRLDKAVLYGAGLSVNKARRFDTVAETSRKLQAEGVDATVKRVVASWFADTASQAQAHRLCLEAGRGMAAPAAAAAIQAMEHADFTGRLRQIHTPTLVMAGEAERSHPPPSALELQRAMGNAHLCLLPFCGHAAHLEQPEWFAEILLHFLQRKDR